MAGPQAAGVDGHRYRASNGPGCPSRHRRSDVPAPGSAVARFPESTAPASRDGHSAGDGNLAELHPGGSSPAHSDAGPERPPLAPRRADVRAFPGALQAGARPDLGLRNAGRRERRPRAAPGSGSAQGDGYRLPEVRRGGCGAAPGDSGPRRQAQARGRGREHPSRRGRDPAGSPSRVAAHIPGSAHDSRPQAPRALRGSRAPAAATRAAIPEAQ